MTVSQSTRSAGTPDGHAGRAARVAVVGGPTKGNRLLARRLCGLGFDAALLTPAEAVDELESGDVAFDRIDVLPTLDGVAPGLEELALLVGRGVRVVNPPQVLLSTHDKLVTCGLLSAAGVRQPAYVHVGALDALESVSLPCVVKPRFGSWGADVFRCRDRSELADVARTIADRPWFRRHGALVQELMPTPGRDLRVLAASGRVVGAARRIAAPGEWRTNVTLGGSLERLERLDAAAAALSLAAAAALRAELVGIDLLQLNREFVVIELNGAPEFDDRYSLPGTDVFAELAAALGLRAPVTAHDAQAPAHGIGGLPDAARFS